ncbi:3,4-dehydroadipyl-CoA semialdehyde dehydrogenase [Leptothrix discophora]|uniref:3,4-dehydroadipyl-CoA semialdehyde dehydrogenase n=1 Tax=Leptothrix discophora TaxID=89 RepID=A0ABT9G0M3_LEPDI|nr:3,4-dehydroadipyl-CoA semialdehyde dehydrogenase [Leptothrix discophora]MDP4300012.1 3,4-dehydroadipyl-CoA semialdehyde dehydrogenase [Leptothrix discophora]
MTELLPNFVHGAWVTGTGAGTPLVDPVTGAELVRVSSAGLDLPRAFAFAREQGGAALRAMTFGQRAERLAAIAKLLQSHREAYGAIALADSGTTAADTAVDVDGGIYTLGQYARWGAKLGDAKALLDGGATPMSKDGVFQSQHLLVPTRGVALFINAFNFPSWGLWEKAAPALLAGVPVIVKPATATAWLTQRMVADVVASGLLPEGALSVICGSSAGLLDQLQPFDVLSFTGSAQTAELIRSHPAVVRHSVRVNIEADSLNSALLMPGASDEAQALFVREVVREMTVKSGQKCTAIRRALVPQDRYESIGAAIAAKLAGITTGDPRDASVRMGALVSREQFDAVQAGIVELATQARVLFDGRRQPLVGADPAVSACLAPTLLACDDPDGSDLVHRVEVFGPVATLMPYRDLAHAQALIARGEGSLVCSLYGDTDGEHASALAACATELAACHGRVHIVSPSVATTQTGHGNVMPQSLHGGPGRAGGGEELGGLRALGFYLRRAAVQADGAVIQSLGALPLTV